MHELVGKSIIVTGGSRGLGLALVETLVERGAKVTVLARDTKRLNEIKKRLGVAIVTGDIVDRELDARTLRSVRPDIVVLNAGVPPIAAPLHQQTWDGFTQAWDTDVRAAFNWIQEAIALPLAKGSRVLLGSSGAAIGRSPLAGGLSGAKRAMWSMATYANFSSELLGIGLKFQAIVPMQIFAETDGGHIAAEAYARRKGLTAEAWARGNFGNPMTPKDLAAHITSILTDPQYESGTVYGVKPDLGITLLDG